MFKKKQITKSILVMIFLLVVSVSATVGFSYAAYIYNNRYQNVLDFNTGVVSTQFASGNGTAESPYAITNSQHLRNLQKLTVLGLFTNNTNFKLQNSFTYDGEDLYPIGTEDNPFYGVFQGNGKTITNLVVNGTETNDVGMFGYVAYGSVVKNFILSSPTIKVGANLGGGTLRTTNPLAASFLTEAQSLSLAFTQRSGNVPAYFTPNKQTVTVGGINYAITYESTNTSLLVFNNNRFEVQVPPTSDPDYYPVQLNAKILAYSGNKIISHTLERWNINVNKAGTVNVASGDVKVGYWKTINDTDNNSFGVHQTYVGIFVGHLDGEAKYLGVYGDTRNNTNTNARILVSGRGARSYSTLVGRTLDDNINDPANAKFTRMNFNFGDYKTGFPSDGSPIIWTTPTQPTNSPDATAVNNFITGTRTTATTISSYYGLTTTQQNYFRIYGSAQNKKISFNAGTLESPIYESNYPAFTLNQIMKGYASYSTSFLQTGGREPSMNQGFYVWMSADAASGFSAIFNTTGYQAQINIRYVVPSATYNAAVATNYFRILKNDYKTQHTLFSPALSTEYWSALPTDMYSYSDHPVVVTENGQPVLDRVIEQTLSFTVTKSGSLNEWWGGPRQTVMLIGVGGPNIISKSRIGSGNPQLSITELDGQPFEINILDFDIFFSSLEGNLSRQMVGVDYINSTTSATYNATTDAWSNWILDSRTRIRFNVEQSLLTGTSSATYRFYRATGSNGKVNAYYSGLTGSTYALENTEGFKTANITNA